MALTGTAMDGRPGASRRGYRIRAVIAAPPADAGAKAGKPLSLAAPDPKQSLQLQRTQWSFLIFEHPFQRLHAP
jgi:hypothetical protein